MKLTRIHDPYHNPFHNRFRVPVHSRLDEMQAYTHMVWLSELRPSTEETKEREQTGLWWRACAGAFALLLVVVVSVSLLSN